ncbi:MAG: energy transducer TonB [Acidobacteriaceae bacterium]
MDIGSLIRASEGLPSSRSVSHTAGGVERGNAGLLELRTEFGPIYVCPSRWERIRLRWAFRHFHVLAPQVLSHANQILIEKLASSAVVTPELPVAQERVLGVVESVGPESRTSAAQAARQKARRPQAYQPLHGRPGNGPSYATLFPVDPAPIPIRRETKLGVDRKARFVRDARSQQWGALAALAAIGLVLIVARFYDPSLLRAAGSDLATVPVLPAAVSNRATVSVAAKQVAAKQAAVKVQPGPIPELTEFSPPALLPRVRPKQLTDLPGVEPPLFAEKTSPRLAAPLPSPPPPAVASTNSRQAAYEPEGVPAPSHIATSSDPALLFVSELPQGHFAEPVVTNPKLVGELRLRALIGSDGSVKEVTVVSGDPKLAEAGMRAVRRWRYQALGHPGEAETLIRMRFFGEDGVSIASIAK